jgi:hypothetical protein
MATDSVLRVRSHGFGPIECACVRKIAALLLSFAVLGTAGGQDIRSDAGSGDVVITEIMYHPYHSSSTAEDTRQEWVELYNAGGSPVDLAGWRFSDGVDYVFPDVELRAGGYLVVAADVAVFSSQHPGVANVVGGWAGWLSNSGETITLVDDVGDVMDSVPYADEGDWAVRELGPVDHGHRGWQWSDQTDGGGKSLELVNVAMPNELGQNWAASALDGGTPGRTNSVAASNTAPMIVKVRQSPAIPGPSNSVTIIAGVVDESLSTTTVRVRYRVDRSAYSSANTYPEEDLSDFTSVEMLDDGGHGDGMADDGVYGASIPPQWDGTVIEFFIEAVDDGGRIRRWPAPSLVDGRLQQVTNALYRVDAAFNPYAYWQIGGQPLYYLVMTEMERDRLATIGSHSNGEEDTEAAMNGTFISIDGTGVGLQYRAAIRNRGHGTRTGPPNNFHVGFPSDDLWKGLSAINFNCRYTHAQIIGSAIFEMAGMAAADTTPAQLRINGASLASSGSPMFGVYVRLEAFDGDFAKRHFPGDPNGNLYACFRDAGEADLRYRGTNPDTYRPSYFKESNVSADDWSDLIHMVDVLNNAPETTYFQDVSKVIDVSQWLHYIGLDSLLLNYETGLRMGIGDDYFMYRGVADPRFVLIPHDLDTILHEGNTHPEGSIDQSVFSIVTGVSGYNGVDGLKRFFAHPDIVPFYYQAILDIVNGPFRPEKLDGLFDQVLGGFTPPSRIDAMKQFVRERRAAVLAQIPQSLTITDAPAASGDYAYTLSSRFPLAGQANAARTRRVTVAGQPATWIPVGGDWSVDHVMLMPGVNHVIVRAFDANDMEFESSTIDIWYDTGTMTVKAGGPIDADQLWTAADGPYRISGNIVVPAGRTLTIEPGTTLFFDSDASLTVNGRLLAEGTPDQWITLTRTPGSDHWAGLQFQDTEQESRLVCVSMQYCDSGSCAISADHAAVTMDHIVWDHHAKQYLTFDDSSIVLKNSILPSLQNAELVHFLGMPEDGYALFEGNWFGSTTGYNDIIDLTGGQRPGPIARFINNTFTGASDDCIDLDGADAHIEGNVFMHVHSDGTGSGESHAVTTGADGSRYSELTVVRNLFYDVDHAMLCKDSGFITAVNNTVVHATHAAVNMYEARSGQWQGRGFYGDGNIFWDVAHVFENPDWAGHPTAITMNNSIFPVVAGDPVVWDGSDNLEDVDPLLVRDANLSDPLHDMRLLAGSAAIGAGPNGRDMGGLVPPGASIAGEPAPVTWRTYATLTVGGPDIYGYKYRVNGGPWSGEVIRPDADVAANPEPLPPIELTDLQNGQAYVVYVIGKDSAGFWQSEETPTASRTWVVDTSYRDLVINEVLADNESVLEQGGAFPDMVELYYDGPAAMSLSGMSLSDDPAEPGKFVFPAGATIDPGEYLVLYADGDVTAPGLHLGFAFHADGEAVTLYDKTGAIVDSIEFGVQLPDLSIGRVGSTGQWRLTVPTFGSANVACPLGDPRTIRISEWLASEEVLFDADFIELYNPHPSPVDLGGFCLTDATEYPAFAPTLGPLTFIAGQGFLVLTADGKTAPGHAGFKLSSGGDKIALLDPGFNAIDRILFSPQTTDISQGRCPESGDLLDYLVLPTPGLPNPATSHSSITPVDLILESAAKRAIVPASATQVGENWKSEVSFDDSGWLSVSGLPGGVGYERSTGYEDFISLDVQSQMYQGNTTCYIRIPFSVSGNVKRVLSELYLSVRYDDGFVAYLNGTEVGRVGFSGAPQWNSTADTDHEASSRGFDFMVDLSDRMALLREGDNLLAIQGLNVSRTSSDFIIAAILTGAIVETQEVDTYPYTEQLKLLDGLRVTELMYNNSPGNDLEYVELQNIGGDTLDLTGVRFTDGIDFTFPPMGLSPGEYVVVVSNLSAFRSSYGAGINVAGEFTGRLSNGGENLVLKLAVPLEAAIARFHYDDAWYPATDGAGKSLTIRDPTLPPVAWNDPQSWRPADPTPGRP